MTLGSGVIAVFEGGPLNGNEKLLFDGAPLFLEFPRPVEISPVAESVPIELAVARYRRTSFRRREDDAIVYRLHP